MKTRAGFVSNSSSSSFVVVGLPIADTGKTVEELNEISGIQNFRVDDGEEGSQWVGIYHYIGEWESKAFSLTEINNAAKRFEEKIGKAAKINVGVRYG